MKPKRIKCPNCGERYGRGVRRCPACLEPNPKAVPPGVSFADRLFGILLIALGLAIGIPILWIFFWSPHFLIGGRRGWGLLLLIPVGLVFQGLLFLIGVHPRDFFAWWENRSDLSQFLVIGFLCLVGVGALILLFFVKD
jgi:hypothetical protein